MEVPLVIIMCMQNRQKLEIWSLRIFSFTFAPELWHINNYWQYLIGYVAQCANLTTLSNCELTKMCVETRLFNKNGVVYIERFLGRCWSAA